MKKERKAGSLLRVLLALAAFVFLACHFFNNRWQLNPYDTKFRNWQLDSEQLVVDKVMDARSHGIGNYNGMMLEYQQQIGFAGILFSVVDKLADRHAGLTEPIPKDVMCAVNVVLFTALFFVLLYWLYREFGLWVAGATYGTALFTHWLGFTPKNLYWVTWTMLLPMVAALALLLWEEKKGKAWNSWLFGISFLTIFLRSACGYEFISCVMVALELPLIYFGVKKSWSLGLYVKRSLVAGLGALLGFASALSVNLALMAGLKGWQEALDYLIFVSARRTGYTTLEGFDPDVLASFQVPLTQVLRTYWQGDPDCVIFGKWNLNLLIPLFFLLAAAMVVTLFFWRRGRDLSAGTVEGAESLDTQERRMFALILTMGISLLGPLSWLVLAKGHAVHHPHIDYVIFCLPFTVLGFASVAQELKWWVLHGLTWLRSRKTGEKGA
ncbi:MAG: hypothetical protein HFI33_10375 [Lachnospiraceae bacterium]|nr:hypothetical protein [Lachnospiraceae bacterium]